MSESPDISQFELNREKKKTMKVSVKEGSAAAVMAGAGEAYITPFALSIGASNFQIGLLSALPALVSPISQLVGSKLMETHPRKKIAIFGPAMQALMWFPIIALGLIYWYGHSNYVPLLLVIIYPIYALFGAGVAPSWFSLLGDIVPKRVRGKYFGKRNKICTAVTVVTTVTVAFLLDFFKTKGLVLLGFSIVFAVASIARMISAWLLSRHYEPPFKLEGGYYFSFLQFLKKAPGNNFGKFVIYTGLIYFAVMIASPFFAVYMLKTLKFSYTTFVLVNISSTVFNFIFSPALGKFADKFGNRELMKFASFLIPFLPFLWLFSGNPFYLAFVPQLAGGLGWAAFTLASSNFIYDTVTPQRRGICVTYFNIFIYGGTFLGSVVGGIMAAYIPITFMNNLLFIFVISGILRALVSIIMLPKIKEVRQVRPLSSKNPLVYIKEMNLVEGVIYETLNDAKILRKQLLRPAKFLSSLDL
jgi:MFS family permease